MPKYFTSFVHGRNVPDREHKRSQFTSLRGPARLFNVYDEILTLELPFTGI